MQAKLWTEKTSEEIVIANFGLGVDSSSFILRLLLEPLTRDFPLQNLIVITAIVGDEWPSSIRAANNYMLPLFQKFGVRYVQVARRGPSESDGIEILDDSRSPEFVYARGQYSLSDELQRCGTVATWRKDTRKCSAKFKGFPCDSWIKHEFGGKNYRQLFGFNSDELYRSERDFSYSKDNRKAEYPLQKWGWNRQVANDFIFDKFGVFFEKSCCQHCPYSNGKQEVLFRYIQEPEALFLALRLEHNSLALNPLMTLFPSGSLREAMMKVAPELVLQVEAQIIQGAWRLYRVRRIRKAKTVVWRKVEHVSEGSYADVILKLHQTAEANGQPVTHEGGHPRVYLLRRTDESVLEDMFAIAPACIDEKARPGFDAAWTKAITPVPSLPWHLMGEPQPPAGISTAP